ncbi:hypothetical protein B0H10DRAFT_1943808 [Mycena sp. CBHHK59/15]|nr:hypothetical protein B0H10DRAFT_1943808 [Mycena sp. CBHHK59/15]
MKYLFLAAAVFSFGVASALADVFAFDLHLPSNPSKCITATGTAANSPLIISDCFSSLPTGPNPPSQSFFAIYPTEVAESGNFGSIAVNFHVGDALNNMCLTVPSGNIDDGVQLQIQTCLNPAKNRQLFRMVNGPASGTIQILWDAQGKCVTNGGTAVTTVDCNGSSTQLWSAEFAVTR